MESLIAWITRNIEAANHAPAGEHKIQPLNELSMAVYFMEKRSYPLSTI